MVFLGGLKRFLFFFGIDVAMFDLVHDVQTSCGKPP